jgi:hypothetical protein
LVVGLEGEHAGGIGKRDAVAISFKLDQGLRGALHRQDEAGIIIGFGQRSQEGLFLLGKDVPGSFPGGSVNPAVGHFISPGGGLKVQIGQGEEGSSGEEIIFDIADDSFDPSLLVGGFHIAGGGIKEVVSRKGQEARVELDGGAESLEDHTP